MTKLFDLVRLNLTGCMGAGRLRKLLSACGSLEEIFNLSHESIQQICAVGPKSAQRILDDKYSGWAATELKRVEKLGYRLIPHGDRLYPQLLAQIHDPPLVLYVRGRVEGLDLPSVAIVGTRKCSRYGREAARRIAGELVSVGITVVSGLALGIDGEAHEGALEAGGRTVAVLGCGVDDIYPPEHVKLAERIESAGAVLSEFPLGSKPRKENFPRRNRIISGLSLGVLVAEAPVRSGALITARTATEQGREVFAIPGRIDNLNATGCLALIKDGAKLTQSVNDIVEEIAPQLLGKLGDARPLDEAGPGLDLTDEERKVLDALDKDPTPLDTVIVESGLEPSVVSGVLTKLQLRHLVEKLPGSMYARK